MPPSPTYYTFPLPTPPNGGPTGYTTCARTPTAHLRLDGCSSPPRDCGTLLLPATGSTPPAVPRLDSPHLLPGSLDTTCQLYLPLGCTPACLPHTPTSTPRLLPPHVPDWILAADVHYASPADTTPRLPTPLGYHYRHLPAAFTQAPYLHTGYYLPWRCTCLPRTYRCSTCLCVCRYLLYGGSTTTATRSYLDVATCHSLPTTARHCDPACRVSRPYMPALHWFAFYRRTTYFTGYYLPHHLPSAIPTLPHCACAALLLLPTAPTTPADAVPACHLTRIWAVNRRPPLRYRERLYTGCHRLLRATYHGRLHSECTTCTPTHRHLPACRFLRLGTCPLRF